MRSIVLGVLVAAGVGMLGTAGTASAAPISGLSVTPDSNVTQVQHWRWGSRGRHYRYGSRGWRNCHVRRWSRWARC